MSMWRWIFAVGLCVCTAGWSGEPAPARPVARVRTDPNVVLIVVEGAGWADLGCQGQTNTPTPNLDRLAAEGLRLTHAVAQDTNVVRTRRTLLLGLAPELGKTNAVLGAKDWTLASTLQQAGYSTAAFGVWGLGGDDKAGWPNAKGFEEWFGFLGQGASADAYPATLWRNGEEILIPQNAGGKAGILANDFFTQAAANFMRQRQRRPFFCYVAYALPAPGKKPLVDEAFAQQAWTPEQKHWASVWTRLDRDVGRLMTTLKDLRLEQHTLVVWTSVGAGGRSVGSTEFFRSRSVVADRERVPLLMWRKEAIRAGLVADMACGVGDVMPTILDGVGIGIPPTLSGRSLKPLFGGGRGGELRIRN